jgi:uncharacterized protein
MTGMERMILGRTGLDVCRLGFGGIPIQRVSEAEAVATVRHVIEAGVDFIDTSRAYTTSERRIGLALKELAEMDGRPIVDGRGPAPGAPPAGGDDGAAAGSAGAGSAAAPGRRVVIASRTWAQTADGLRGSLETSLQELGRDYLDIYECHAVQTHEAYEKVIGPGGALEALRQARDEGLIGHIGITSHNLEVLDRSLDDGLFDTLLVCFSFLEPKARDAIIPKALERNVGVRAMKVFSGGVIEEPRLSLQWALAEPGVLLLVGLEHSELFDEDWREFREGGPLTPAEQDRVAELQRTFDKAVCRRCDYCQPCPQEIQIQVVLGAKSMAKRMGMQLVQNSPFWATLNRGRECTECGECMTRCPYGLPIPDLIAANLRWLDERVV